MHDWFVTVLVSIRDMAAKNGMVALAEEMDVAILVAANEKHGDEMADLGKVDVRATQHDLEPAEGASDAHGIRRYH